LITYKFIPAEQYGKFFLEELIKEPIIAIDVETSGLLWYKDYIKTIAFSTGVSKTGVVAPFGTNEIQRLKDVLKEFLHKYEGIQVYHNAKFDLHMIREFLGVPTNFFYDTKISDTMIMACLLDENRYVGLKALAKSLLGVDPVSMEDDLLYYNAQDAENTIRLYEKFKPEIKSSFYDLYLQELDLVKCLIDVEYSGMYIDVPYFEQLRSNIQKQLIEWQQGFISTFGRKVNPNSAEQLAWALRALGFESHINLTDIGNESVPNSVLEGLATSDATINNLLEYRKSSKLLTTYVKNYLEMNVDGVLYPNFNMSTSEKRKVREDGRPIATGRLSSDNPNLQNVPVRDSDIIRRGFVVKEKPFYYLDYSNIEFRIAAHYSGEPALIKAYKEGGDMHQVTADALGVDRDTGKTMNFAIIYGAGSKKIARSLGVSEDEAKKIINDYHIKFPRLYGTQIRVVDKINRDNYVTNMYGRRRRLTNDEAYKGFNSLIQGSAADMFKAVMVKNWRLIRNTGNYTKIPIHDELVYEIQDIELLREIKNNMETEPILKNLKVPIPVDVARTNTNWAEEEEVII